MPLTARQKFGSMPQHYRIEARAEAEIVTLVSSSRMSWPALGAAAAQAAQSHAQVWIFEGHGLGGPQYIVEDGAIVHSTPEQRAAYWQAIVECRRQREAAADREDEEQLERARKIDAARMEGRS